MFVIFVTSITNASKLSPHDDDNTIFTVRHNITCNVRSQRVKAPSSFDPLLSENVFSSVEQLTVNLGYKVELEW